MSLYTYTKTDSMPVVRMTANIVIEECVDMHLLAMMGTTSVDDVRKRLANDHVAFVARINNQPAAFGWMARGMARIGELNHDIVLPEGHRYFWNFRTVEAFRGLGIYPALLQYIIRYEDQRAERFWIIHAPENKSSLSGIVKAGFQFVGKLYINDEGNAAIEKNNSSEALQDVLQYMDIDISHQPAASCWNCSSPYLKKRTPKCCCEPTSNECIGKNSLALAS